MNLWWSQRGSIIFLQLQQPLSLHIELIAYGRNHLKDGIPLHYDSWVYNGILFINVLVFDGYIYIRIQYV